MKNECSVNFLFIVVFLVMILVGLVLFVFFKKGWVDEVKVLFFYLLFFLVCVIKLSSLLILDDWLDVVRVCFLFCVFCWVVVVYEWVVIGVFFIVGYGVFYFLFFKYF